MDGCVHVGLDLLTNEGVHEGHELILVSHAHSEHRLVIDGLEDDVICGLLSLEGLAMDDAADDAEMVERDGKRSHDVEGFNYDFDVGGLLLVTILGINIQFFLIHEILIYHLY